MKYTFVFFIMLFCSQDNNKKNKENNDLNHKIVEIHLSRTLGMIDMTKNVSHKYYSLNKKSIYVVQELSNPQGKMIKLDTIKIINEDNIKIFQDLENYNNLNSFFSDGLQDDSSGWAFTLFYSDKQEKSFVFTSSDEIPRYATKVYDLLNRLENNN